MEKKDVNKKGNMFENLRIINSVVNSNSLAGVFTNIKTAKQGLDGFCKRVKEQISTIEAKNAAKNVAATAVKKPTATKPVVEEVVKFADVMKEQDSAAKQPVREHKPASSAATPRQNANFNRGKGDFSNTNKQSFSNNSQQGYDSKSRAPYQQGQREGAWQNRTSYSQSSGRTQQGGVQGRQQQGVSRTSFTPGANTRQGEYKSNRTSFTPGANTRQGEYKSNRTSFTPGNRPQQGGDRGAMGGRQQQGAQRTGFTPGAANRPSNIVSFTNKKPSPAFDFAAQPKSSFGGNKAKTRGTNDSEKKGLNVREKIRMGLISLEDGENSSEVIRIRGTKRPKYAPKQEKIEITHVVFTEENLTVKSLSEKLGKPAAEIIKKLLLLGLMYNINSVIDSQTAELIASDFGITAERKIEKTYEEKLSDLFKEQKQTVENKFVSRPPVIAVMGHVDHGKTSLLDFIKKSHVVQGEAGGITQHIGAYSINVNNRDITFIDTPGHEAFSMMRQRGATVADIAILIVAADDGVMPQTVEAIKHIKDAGTPMIVAVNKVDKPTANIERVKQQLTEHNVLIEEWGGDTILVPISAKNGQGIEKLLEMILLVSDVNDFKANPALPASGTCLEAKVDTGRGIVANIIIKNGTLSVGDYIVCGLASGRVRSMSDYLGKSVKAAGPSMAVSVVGLDNVPSAGDMAYVVDERMAKNLILERSNKIQIEKTQSTSGTTLENFMLQDANDIKKIYNIIIKADVHGTCEALTSTLEAISNEEVNVSCVSSGVGIVTETDVVLAKASNSQIIAFNTKIDAKARQLAEKTDVKINQYKVIYEAADFITKHIDTMLTPKFKENETGRAEVRQLFKVSSLGVIAGCYVLQGIVAKSASIRVMRGNDVVADTTIDTLRQEKNEAKQVREGFECGIHLKNFNNILVGDILVAYENVRI